MAASRWSSLRERAIAPLVSIALLTACSGAAADDVVVPAPAPGDVAVTLFLIGDAGDPDPEGEPVLKALADQLESTRGEDVVVFLGDNIYPKGLPPPESGKRQEMERRIDAQVDVVLEGGAQGIFLPGNHDWDAGGKHGWQNVLREEEHVNERGGGRVRWLPPGGRPGPSVVDIADYLRIIVIDSQWFLHDGPKPMGGESETSGAIARFRRELVAALKDAGGRQVVVVAHHPIMSTGPHGGDFTLKDHLFPLTRLDSKLWVPLPVIGSLYVLSRKAGNNTQDQSSTAYKAMVETVEGAMAEAPPLLHAAGHHHALEVFTGRKAELYVVSGAGYYGHSYPSSRREETLFNDSASGFMRLDIMKDRSLRLGVLTVNEDGEAREAFSIRPRGE